MSPGRKPTCECGHCRKCRNREAQQRRRDRLNDEREARGEFQRREDSAQ